MTNESTQVSVHHEKIHIYKFRKNKRGENVNVTKTDDIFSNKMLKSPYYAKPGVSQSFRGGVKNATKCWSGAETDKAFFGRVKK